MCPISHEARKVLQVSGVWVEDGSAFQNISQPDQKATSTIVYSTVGRAQYAFDIYSRDLDNMSITDFSGARETQMTDGVSINTNGAFDR